MESNSNEKKPKRPRIGQTYRVSEGQNTDERPRFQRPEGNEDGEYRPKRPYQPRPQGGYNNGYQQRNNYNNGGYQQRPGAYQPRPYQPRPQRPDFENNEGHTAENGEEQQRPAYQPRPYQPRPQNGYGNNHQGAYNNRQQGGYQPRQNGGYNNRQGQPRQQGGYNNRQGGYNNNRQNGYNNNRQGGYNNRPNGYGNNRQGGYNNRQQGGYQQQGGFPARGKSFTPRPKPVEYEMPIPDPNEQIRLNKYMSNAGICSRREADEFIQQGLVKVNGVIVTELGTKISHSDVVEYDEKVVTMERKCYILLNKPKDCVTTSDDPSGRLTVMDLVKGACNERIYPVGRLDRNTTGVLLLTNDGDLASKLTHPKFVKKKIYHVWCDRDIAEDDMQRIADGIELEDGPIHADAISYATETDRNQAGIEIHSGRNRIVRRIFESLGYHVTKLDRVYFAGLTKKNLPRGRWRYLTQEEVNYLKMGSFE